jgi:hypothetical protein
MILPYSYYLMFKSLLAAHIGNVLATRVSLDRRTTAEPATQIQKLLKANSHRVAMNDAHSAGDVSYWGPIFVGTPFAGKDTDRYIYDTSSGYLDVPALYCNTCADQVY